ncbi:MAG: tetratricopeptide repeat protein, partial [bacterium]|nr:tetratricopeptide repeat protein [bacterium]
IATIYLNRNSKPEVIDAYLRMAAVYETKGETKKQARCYENILEESPVNFKALKKLTELYAKLDDKDRLIVTLSRLAKLFIERGEKENALNLYSKLLQLDPSNSEAQKHLGKSIRAVSVLPDDDSDGYVDLNIISDSEIPVIEVGEIKGDPIDPGATIKTAGELLGVDLPGRRGADPNNAQVFYDLGIAYLEMGLYEEAVQYLQFSSRNPDFRLRSCNMLGLCFLDRDMAEVAIKEFERALGTPNISEEEAIGLFYNLSLAYERAGQFSKALDELRKVYAVNIGYLDVKERLENLRQRVTDDPTR